MHDIIIFIHDIRIFIHDIIILKRGDYEDIRGHFAVYIEFYWLMCEIKSGSQ